MKTIAIIGGMGPQASVHAHNMLVKELAISGKQACIVHVSIPLEPFYTSKPVLKLTKRFKELLGAIDADTGFIACNTVHHFFCDFQDSVSFKLENIVDNSVIPVDSIVFCSPTAKQLKIYTDVKYITDQGTAELSTIVDDFYAGKEIETNRLTEIVNKYKEDKNPVFACSEISLLAHEEKLKGYDPMLNTINKIVRDL